MARMTLSEALARPSTIDREKLAETTEEHIRRYQTEDGHDPDEDVGREAWSSVLPPQDVRRVTRLSQAKFAAALGIPSATIENWEQGRTRPDPAARTLLNLIARDYETVFRLLGVTPERREPRAVQAREEEVMVVRGAVMEEVSVLGREPAPRRPRSRTKA